MKVWIVTRTVAHETCNEFYGVFSSKELALKFIFSHKDPDTRSELEADEQEVDDFSFS